MIDAVNANARATDGRKEYPDDARRRRLVWLAARAVERRRARGLVLVDARRRSRARRRAIRGSQFLDGKNAGYPEAALRRDLESIPQQAGGDARRSDAARQAARRQHARLQPGGDRRARPADVRRARAGPRGRAAQRAPALLRSRAPAGRRAGGRRRARLRARRSPHRRDARQRQPDDGAHGHRAGGRLRRAPVRIGRSGTDGREQARTRATSPCSSRRAPARRSRSRCDATSTRRPSPFPWDR